LDGELLCLKPGNLANWFRMLEERGAEAIPCPMIAIRDAPDAEPVAAWIRWFVEGTSDDLVLMTGEGLRRLLGLAQRTGLESAFLDALRTTRKITRGPKPVRALREVGLDADISADEPTTEGIIAAMRRHDFSGRSVGVQLNPGNPNRRLVDFIKAAGPVPYPVLPYVYVLKPTMRGCSLSSAIWLPASSTQSPLRAPLKFAGFAM
jgi:uroporphyrinogen-III synthase